jgi:DNA-binding CsgD family transcriptional regulator
LTDSAAWRRQGDLDRALSAYDQAVTTATGAKNIYAQLTCASNRAYTEGLGGKPGALAVLASLREQATTAGLGFVANKCAVFQAVLAFQEGATCDDLASPRSIVPKMLELGQHNFLASELCQRGEFTLGVCRQSSHEIWLPELISCLSGHAGCEVVLERVAALDGDLARLVVDQAATSLPSARAQALLGHLSKSHSPAVRRAARPLIVRKKPGGLMPELTDRESRVLELMASGLKNADIASRLYLSQATVKTHINRIFRKLQVTDRVSAVLYYRDRVGRQTEARSKQGIPTRPVPK